MDQFAVSKNEDYETGVVAYFHPSPSDDDTIYTSLVQELLEGIDRVRTGILWLIADSCSKKSG